MKLKKALDLKGDETIVFVGTSGKMSAILALTNEFKQQFIISTGTPIDPRQTILASKHVIVNSDKDIEFLDCLAEKTILLTGPIDKDGRLRSLNFPTLKKIQKHCKERGLPFLIEADEAKLQLLQEPPDHEPTMPPWVDFVIVLVGMKDLEKKLNEKIVFKPDLFVKLSGVELGETNHVCSMERVLRSTTGGLKGIPESAKKILFLNQVENDLIASKACRLANKLEDIYDRVLIGSLTKERQDDCILSVHSQTAGIILAAGESQRLGKPKQLLEWEGQPFISYMVKTALAAGLAPIIVVTGAYKELIEDVLMGLPVKCVHNPDWKEGQSTSVRTGVTALPQGCDRAMFILSDQPQIPALLLCQLIQCHNQKRLSITAPQTRERRGNPVLFSKETFSFLQTITGDRGGREAFSAFQVDYLPWIDDRILIDVDQETDIEKLNNAFYLGKRD